MMRAIVACLLAAGLTAACTPAEDHQAHQNAPVARPTDSEHAGVVGPHGDHSPHRGGMVLMKDDLHYEVVFSRDGRHQVWFTDAMRNDLPASLASHVTMTVTRPNAAVETLALRIDDAGEAWVAQGLPVEGDDVMVKVSYAVMGETVEIDLPFYIPTTP
jgi:hypothetical protein